MLLSIVIPVYNECEVLPALLAALRRTLASHVHYELIFVDDGSTDGTSEALRHAAAADPLLKVIFFSRRAVIAIGELREQHRFMRGIVAWLGLREVILPYHRNARVAGKTKYSPVKMFRFAWTAITSFSALPLRLSVFFGFFVASCGFAYAAYSVF